MRKGSLVKLNPDKCFTTDNGGKRGRWNPLGNSYEDEQGIVSASRPTTGTEQEAWRTEKYQAIKEARAKGEPVFGIAHDDAGESRLAPRSVTVNIHRDDLLVVERARCQVSLGWGKPTPGMAKVMLPNGEDAYLKRELLIIA